MNILGIDTSNYTTSVALYNTDTDDMKQVRRLLTVKPGELGLRQADAVFQHTMNLPKLTAELSGQVSACPDMIAVSYAPTDEKGSYMPCFTVGLGLAQSMSAVMRLPVKTFSHQAGHIAAAVYSAGKTELLQKPFIAFHVSGGTTQSVLVEPDKEKIIKTTLLSRSLDLKAGQAIDRVGKLLELPFPAGQALDELSLQSEKSYKIHPFMRDGNCSLSGLENQCEKMVKNGEKREDVAKFCIQSVMEALTLMTVALRRQYPDLPLVYSGGVMSNTLIRAEFEEKYRATFAAPGFSSDNAAGIAVLGSR